MSYRKEQDNWDWIRVIFVALMTALVVTIAVEVGAQVGYALGKKDAYASIQLPKYCVLEKATTYESCLVVLESSQKAYNDVQRKRDNAFPGREPSASPVKEIMAACQQQPNGCQLMAFDLPSDGVGHRTIIVHKMFGCISGILGIPDNKECLRDMIFQATPHQ